MGLAGWTFQMTYHPYATAVIKGVSLQIPVSTVTQVSAARRNGSGGWQVNRKEEEAGLQ